MKNEFALNWRGMLTINNIEQVVDRLRLLLVRKTYTFVAVNEFLEYRPKVLTGQILVPNTNRAISAYYSKDKGKFGGFLVSGSSGVWGCTTNLHNNLYDPEFNNPHIIFQRNQVNITHRTPEGRKLFWVIWC